MPPETVRPPLIVVSGADKFRVPASRTSAPPNEAEEPETVIVPALTVRPPVIAIGPESVSVPAPTLVNVPTPLTLPLKVSEFAPPTLLLAARVTGPGKEAAVPLPL